MLDGNNENPKINLHKEIILHHNIVDLFKKYAISEQFGILSEDTDYADYWVVEAILTKYKPKVVIHEVNQQPPNICVTVAKVQELVFWEYQSQYHGGSVCAFRCLAKQNGYTMIYCESAGVNCFWVRNDLLENYLKVSAEFAQKIFSPQFLYRKPKFNYKETKKNWTYISC